MKRWVIILIVLAMLAAAAAVGPDWMPDNSPLTLGELPYGSNRLPCRAGGGHVRETKFAGQSRALRANIRNALAPRPSNRPIHRSADGLLAFRKSAHGGQAVTWRGTARRGQGATGWPRARDVTLDYLTRRIYVGLGRGRKRWSLCLPTHTNGPPPALPGQ